MKYLVFKLAVLKNACVPVASRQMELCPVAKEEEGKGKSTKFNVN